MTYASSPHNKRNLKKVWSAFKDPNSNIEKFVFDKERNPLLIQKRVIDFVERIGGGESKIDACDVRFFIPKLIDLFQATLRCTHFMRDMNCCKGNASFTIDLVALTSLSCYLIEIENNSNYSATTRLESKIELSNKYLEEFSGLDKKGVIFSVRYTEEFKYHVLAKGYYFATADENGYELHLPY